MTTVLPTQSVVGFRFHPTDPELVNHYLKGKIEGEESVEKVIAEVDICKCEPWDLPEKSLIKSKDPEWYFFSRRDWKYANGDRSNRATKVGYWKATGRDRKIKASLSPRSKLIGKKKTLVFHKGRAPKGKKTDWIIHEYWATENEADVRQGSFVLCRLFNKESEKLPSSDEGEPSSLSPTMSISSPEGRQVATDVLEHSVTVQNIVAPDSDLPQPAATVIEEESVPDEAAGTSNPPLPHESGLNSNLAFRAEEFDAGFATMEVEPTLEDLLKIVLLPPLNDEPTFNDEQNILELLRTPIHQQLDHPEMQMVDGNPSVDSPFYDRVRNYQHYEQGGLAERDNPDGLSLEELVCQDASVERGYGDEILQQPGMERFIHLQGANTLESMSGFANVSNSDAYAQLTAPLPPQVDGKMVASASSSWPGLPYVDSENVQPQHLQASSQMESVFGSSSTSLACAGRNVSSVDICAESWHNVITEEPNNGTSLCGSTDNGTGINIIYRQRLHAAGTNSLVGSSPGHATRRIRLQISGQPMFSVANESGSGVGHNEDDASVSMGETVEDITVASGSGPGYYNLEKIQHFSDDDCTHDEPPNSAMLHLAEEFQNKAQLLDSDVCRKTGHVSILRRPRPKQNDARDDIRKGESLQLRRSVKTSFLPVIVALVAIFIIFSLLLFGAIWKGL